MSKKTARKPLSRDELISKCQAGPERIVDVAGVGPVRVRVPSFPRLVELRSSIQNEEDYKLAMVLASCPDLKAEDIEILRNGNGFAVAALVAAVTSLDKPVNDEDVGKP